MRNRNCKERVRVCAPVWRAAFGLMAIAVAVLPPRVAAQMNTTTVQGTVYRADGTPASGTLLLSWSAFTTPQNQAVAAGNLSAPISADGFVSLNLTPNASALPAGSYYTAVYHLSDGTVNQEYWVVPSTATATIAAVRAQLEPSTVAVQGVSQAYVESAISSLSGSWLPLAGGAMTGPLTLNSDPAAQNQAATKHYADQLAAADLPLSGGNITGLIAAQDAVNKLPRVDITHPDFGAAAGCANGADLTGAGDSTCAIQAAINFAWAQCASLNPESCPAVYIPRGTFRINGTLTVPRGLNIIGDGPGMSSILWETNATANLLTVAEPSTPPYDSLTSPYSGSIENVQLQGNDHLTGGTLLELDGTGAYTLNHVRFWNHGGRGLVLFENDEQSKFYDLQFGYVRWPVMAAGDSFKFIGINLAAPGRTVSGYCWTPNVCINGVAPGPLTETLLSAAGNGTTQTYVHSGNGGVSPVAAGNYVHYAGITTTTALNGDFLVSSVSNNTPSSGEFTVVVNGGASGTGNISGASAATDIVPNDRNAAIWSAGFSQDWGFGDWKPLVFLSAFKSMGANAVTVHDIYWEGQGGIYGNGNVNSGLLEPGLPDRMATTGTLANCTVGSNTYACVPGTTAWWPAYVGNPASIAANGGSEYLGSDVGITYVFPCDYNPASSSPSACNSGVQQNQYEIGYGVAAGDGNAYLITRNLSGSTAPANTAWVNAVWELAPSGGGSTGTALRLRNVGGAAAVNTGFSAGYAPYCVDASLLQCQEIELGLMSDGYIEAQHGWGTGAVAAASGQVTMEQEGGIPAGLYAETTGMYWIKGSSNAGVGFPDAGPSSLPETTELTTSDSGAVTQNSAIFPMIAVSGTLTGPNYHNAAAGGNATAIYYDQQVVGPNPAGLGPNPGWSNWFMGSQFYDSLCTADVGTWNGTTGHAQSRFCLRGSANTNGAGLEWDTWNGSIWSPAFSASSSGVGGSSLRTQGAMTGATINGEFTVDGMAYTTVSAAWNAAVSLANTSGQNQTVRLGPGTFPVTTTLTEPANGACVSVLGSAGTTVNADSTQIATTLTVPSALGGDVFYLGNAAQAQGCTFKDLNLLAGGNATHGFELQWFRGVLIDNVTVNDTTAEGILLGEENTAAGHQANFTLRNLTVSYSSAAFTPANRSAYGVHLQKTAIDSHLDNVIVRNALTAAVYNEGTGNTGYLIHGFGYPYTCSTAPCANNASSSSASNASYATSYVIYDTGGSGSVWTDTYADSPAVAGFYVGANGVEIHGGHIQWPDLTSFPAANLATVASSVSNNLLIADVDCLEMASGVNWITYAGASGNPPTYSSVHHLTGCGNYYQALEDAEVTGFSSGGANINDPSSATPRVWSTPIAAGSNYPAYAAQMYTGDQGDAFQAHFSGVNPFFNVTYQGTIRSSGGIALGTVINTASTLTLTSANKNVIANAASGAQTITLPSCYTPLLDRASPTGLEFTIVKSDTSANAVTLQTTNAQLIYSQGASATTLVLSSPSTQTLVCGPDYNWYVAGSASAAVTGNAPTATALAAAPSQCPAGSYATGITANGTANCSQSWHFTWFGYFGGTFGTSTNNSLGSIWSPTAAVNMTRLDIAIGAAPSGCTTYPVIGIYDSTASAWLKTVTLASGTYSYRNAVSGVSIAAGHNLSMGVQTAGVGCTTSPGSAQLTMEYTMNQ